MTSKRASIVVVGSGVAALEFVLALRALDADAPAVTIVTPDHAPALRPLQLLGAASPALDDVAARLGVHVVRGAVRRVEPERHRLLLTDGHPVDYGTLVLAPGAKALPAFDGVLHLGLDAGAPLDALHAEIAGGAVRRLAFVAPSSTGWLIPLYDAALLTAGQGESLELTIVTPETRPLEGFGADASRQVAEALAAGGVRFLPGQVATVEPGRVQLLDGSTVAADRVVAIPLIRGPRISGVPESGPYGLIPVDWFGRVAGAPDVYAVGDATDHPVKQAFLACAQADAAAEHVAAGYGHPVRPTPFQPQPRATLHDHRGVALPLNGGQGVGKLPGRHLAPFLLEHLAAVSPAAPAGR
jgi:sulfide:quinone oxidoreductase